MLTCAMPCCFTAEKWELCYLQVQVFSWSIARSNRKLRGASGKGSNARSLESSVGMSCCRNWDQAKKISLYRQRAVLLTYFAAKAHSEELAAIWRSPENSSISTMLIKTLGSCEDYNNQTYRYVTNNRTWYHYKEQGVPSVGQGVSANCTACSQWHVQGWWIKGGGGRETYTGCQPKEFQQLVQTSWNAASLPGTFPLALG